MAAISYDGQSFIIDSRRVWLVSGGVHYARIPRGLWADRIRSAAQAGLNCIETPVFWDLHEPEPGVFRFTGQHDLKHFVELIAEQGLRCMLRIGPYVGEGWEMGGLPAWLLRRREERPQSGQQDPPEPMRLRQSSPPFLQAVARYLDHVVEQVRELQVTSPAGGPIVAMQNEHQWLCDNPEQGEGYFHQVNRYLREAGCTVPIVTRNNLWQQVSGTMETWHGGKHAFCTARQMHVVQPEAPPLIHVQPPGPLQAWGSETPPGDPGALMRSLMEVSAAGAMFNIDPFCGGTTSGFYAGRVTGSPDGFLTPAHGRHAPVSDTGARNPSYPPVKRLATFLSHFSDLMAHLRPGDQRTVATSGTSVIDQSGSQGSVVFVIRDEGAAGGDVELVTPDGRTLTVPMGDDHAAWVVLNANLGGVTTLDITNLRPWAFIGRKLLVLFGPAGSEALIGIGRTMLHSRVPADDVPTFLRHDPVTVVILNTAQVDAARVTEGGLEIGGTFIGLDGKVNRKKPEPARRPGTPKLGPWRHVSLEDYVSGSAPRFATIDGPQSLEQCGADRGYGWYSVVLNSRKARKLNLLLPQAADRIHIYVKGRLRGVLGAGPGATPLDEPVTLSLPVGESNIVFLADNLGRFADGLSMDRPAGVYGHMLDVKPLTLRRPKVTEEQRVDPFELSGYVPGCSVDAHGPFRRFTWELNLPPSPGLVVSLRGPRPRSVLFVNNHPVAIDPAQGVDFTHTLTRELRKGRNRLTLALLDQTPESAKPFDPAKSMAVFQVVDVPSEDAQWHYARWQLPDAADYHSARHSPTGIPSFFRTTFALKPATAPLTLNIAGGTKGQVYLNGHNLGRYFLTTPNGKRFPTQTAYYLPEPWLNPDAENELVFFDEHGQAPTKSRLSYVQAH